MVEDDRLTPVEIELKKRKRIKNFALLVIAFVSGVYLFLC
jgi:hypothetical protein